MLGNRAELPLLLMYIYPGNINFINKNISYCKLFINSSKQSTYYYYYFFFKCADKPSYNEIVSSLPSFIK